ncbi:MAG: HlyC/CorC family transporter, partial [Rhizobiaceae bacterium]|nr:HlyC/CorC family transporter [Rhizobiaceae bacterium]
MLAIQIAIVAGLILLNGLLAMSELAVVSSRPSRLAARKKEGKRGAARALALAADPGRFLSTVQIGITLVGVLSGAFSGSTLGLRLSEWLVEMGVSPTMANTLGVGGVVAVITYFSLVIGELVPKQVALRNPEGIAMMVAPLMTLLATLASPLVWLLDISGRVVLLLLGQSGRQDSRVTDEEISSLIAEAETQGTIETDERRMIAGVMRLGDRTARAIMTPRSEVAWLNLEADRKKLRQQLIETKHSRLPAANGTIDNVVGVVHTRELLAALLSR